jgi:3-isopropylmalate/(R)-2-methylmalate dehydratase small subunit
VLDHAAVETLLAAAQERSICVDLQQMTVTSGQGDHFTFTMDAFRRDCLLAGLDEIALTLTHDEAITAYEHRMGI